MLEFFGFDFTPLVIGAIGALVGAGAIGWSKLGNLVATSKNTIDDAVWKAVNDAISKEFDKRNVKVD